MKIFDKNETLSTTSVVVDETSIGSVDVTTAGGAFITCAVSVDTNAAGSWAAASLADNHVTITAHGWKTGIVGQVTTAGALPTGLSLLTDYYIIVVDANTVKFASSQVNALAGTAIAISGGTGNSTFTPTALSGCSAQIKCSGDGELWINQASPVAITAGTDIAINVDRPQYRYLTIEFAITSGSLTIETKAIVNKDS